MTLHDTGIPRRSEAELADLREEVFRLKRELHAVIVSHNYQGAEVQRIADFVGDSLELALACARLKSETIVFCGVDFMAETAAILNPEATVLLSAAGASCPMAVMIDDNSLNEWRASYPHAAVVSYVNSTAAVKALSDICCTSANAVAVVESLPHDEILFVPDRNLGHYVSTKTSKRMILYPGCCSIHDRLTAEEVMQARRQYPEARVLVHPECRPEVIELADAALSTSQMLRDAGESSAQTFLIGTEEGLLHQLRLQNPEKSFHLLSASLVCVDMKKTNLESVIETMKQKSNRTTVPEEIALKAKKALDRMLALG